MVKLLKRKYERQLCVTSVKRNVIPFVVLEPFSFSSYIVMAPGDLH